MNLLLDGLVLMVVGMGTVFVFLVLMVFWITLSSRILSRYSHLVPEREESSAPKPASAPGGAGEDETLVAVISAAINQYRAQHRS